MALLNLNKGTAMHDTVESMAYKDGDFWNFGVINPEPRNRSRWVPAEKVKSRLTLNVEAIMQRFSSCNLVAANREGCFQGYGR